MMVNYKGEFIYHDIIVHTPMATNMNIKKYISYRWWIWWYSKRAYSLSINKENRHG